MEEVIVKQYFLSENDFDLIKSKEPTKEGANKILSKYRSFDIELFFNGKEFISPYDIFSLETNSERYDFIFPFASYYIDLKSFDQIRLIENYNAYEWGMREGGIEFYYGQNKVETLTCSFPISKADFIKDLRISSKFIIFIINNFDQKMQMEFTIKN